MGLGDELPKKLRSGRDHGCDCVKVRYFRIAWRNKAVAQVMGLDGFPCVYPRRRPLRDVSSRLVSTKEI